MPIPPAVLLTMSQKIKESRKKAARDLDQTMKTSVMPAISVASGAVNQYNEQSNDPNIRTAAISGAFRDGAMGYQSGGIGGLLAGGAFGAVTSAMTALNRKAENYEIEQNKYLNDMYGSVVGTDTNIGVLANAKDGGEMVSPEADQYVPIQTEAKKVGRKLIKEKLVFADGKMADVNATKPHSEMKKDEVTDVVTQGTYVFPVNTKLNKKDLDFLITYTTGNYSENGKNFAIEEVTLRDILGEDFEGSFAEAADIIDKKYPMMDTDDELDPVTKITNKDNLVHRSKIIAHLIRLNESKINKTPLVEDRITPDMNAKKGGYVSKYPNGGSVKKKDKSEPPKNMVSLNTERPNINTFPFLETVGMTVAEHKSRKFHEDSMKSPGYIKRIRNTAPKGYTDKEKDEYTKEVIEDRKHNLRNTRNAGVPDDWDEEPSTSAIYQSRSDSEGKFNNYVSFRDNETLNSRITNDHEFSHATTDGMGRFLQRDENVTKKITSNYQGLKEYDKKFVDYLRRGTEVKARLDVLKSYADRKGFVKPGEDITPPIMDDLINSIYDENNPDEDLEEVYNQYMQLLNIMHEGKGRSKHDMLGMLWNTIADTKQKQDKSSMSGPVMVAKRGGYVKSYNKSSFIKQKTA